MKNYLFVAFVIYAVSTLISMAAMSVATGILGVAFLVYFKGPTNLFLEIKKELRNKNFKKYFYLSLFLFFACALSLVVAKIYPLSFGGKTSEIHFLKDTLKTWYLFWPLILAVGLKKLSESERNQLVNIWLGAFFVLSILGMFQYFTGWPRPHRIPGNEERFHAVLFMGHHLSVTSIFIFPLFVALDLKKYLWAAAGCMLLFFTYSRMIWVALPIGLFLWAMRSLSPKKVVWIFLILGIVSFTAYQVPAIKGRLHASLGVDDRKIIWQANIDFFRARPLTGVGWMHNHELYGIYINERAPSPFNFVGHAHNNFIQMLSGTGVLGALAWLLWCGFVLLLSWKGSPGLFAAWLVFHMNGLTQVNFWEAKVQHQMAWVVALMLIQSTSGLKKVKRG